MFTIRNEQLHVNMCMYNKYFMAIVKSYSNAWYITDLETSNLLELFDLLVDYYIHTYTAVIFFL